MSNRFFITLLVIIAAICGIFVVTKQKNDNPNTNGGSSSQATNHTVGEGKSGVVLIEYGDLQCPACWQFEPTVKQVIEKYKDRITFQFRNYPLTQLHPNAFAAHRAVEAADKQGKFWEMHDLLFETAHTQDASGRVVDTEWTATQKPQTFFEEYAKRLGLDLAKFNQDMASSEVNDSINADLAQGQKLGISGTPAFILDGVKIENPRSLDDFYKTIDEAIAKKSSSQ